jgi:hypothetical protein
MKKVKFKLDPTTHKKIEALALTLAPLQKTNKQGFPLFRLISQVVKGSEMPPDAKLRNREKVNPEKNYVFKKREALLVNHKINLIGQYELLGQKGIDEYIECVNKIVEKDKELFQKTMTKEEIV